MSKIGLVLSGGMAKGAYEIGALRAISRYLHPEDISACSAASIGAVSAYSFFANDLESVADIWLGLNRVSKRVNLLTAINSDLLQDGLKRFDTQDICLDTFFMPLFKFSGRKLIYQNICHVPKEKIHEYMNAGISCLRPYRMDGELYFDGGAVDNIPIHPMVGLDLDYVICVYFDKRQYIFETEEFDKKVIRIAICEDSLLSAKTLIITKDTTLEMMKRGEEIAESVLGLAFSAGTEPERVLPQVERINRLQRERQLRLTSETVLTNINKLTSLISRRTQCD